MSKNYFIADNKNALVTIHQQIIFWFKERQYDVDHTTTEGVYLIQAKKTGTLRTLTGTNLAFKVKLYWSNDPTSEQEFIVDTSTGQWVSNLAGAGVSAMFTGGITVLTGLAGAGWALVVENEVISYIENTLKFKKIKKIEEPEQKSLDSSSNSNSISSVSNLSSSSVTTTLSPREKAINKGKQDLTKLESAYKDEILTEAEFNAKKAALEKKIDEYEVEFAVEQQVAKLQQAFAQGILDEKEYEAKIIAVEETVKEQIFKGRSNKIKEAQIIKLKQALENGILSEMEYNAKVAAL